MKREYIVAMSMIFAIIGTVILSFSVGYDDKPGMPTSWCTTQTTIYPSLAHSAILTVGWTCVFLFMGLFLYGTFVKKDAKLQPPADRTQTITPDTIQEKWFVNDWEDGFQTFDTEEKAHAEFLKIIDQYREEASGDEWNDDVERVAWGKVFQTTNLMPIDSPHNRDLLPDDPDWDSNEYADAFAIEHRRK